MGDVQAREIRFDEQGNSGNETLEVVNHSLRDLPVGSTRLHGNAVQRWKGLDHF